MRDLTKTLAPYAVLALCIAAIVFARPDASGTQLLSTIVGVCGAAIVPRWAQGQTTTVTPGDPPQVEVHS